MLINFVRYIVSSGRIKLNNARFLRQCINVIVNRRAPPPTTSVDDASEVRMASRLAKIGKGWKGRRSSLVVRFEKRGN